eukprot:4619057-Alexandrium_andersonii.AAC.1
MSMPGSRRDTVMERRRSGAARHWRPHAHALMAALRGIKSDSRRYTAPHALGHGAPHPGRGAPLA